jgi:large subunit ribosomal protein L22
MGVRKRERAEQIKEAKKTMYFAKLNNCPTSPRKMRLVADLVRGEKINKALNILKFSPKEASRRLETLLLSAIANWQAKNEEASIEDADLFVKEIRVDGGAMLKRLRPAPQGRAHRKPKYSIKRPTNTSVSSPAAQQNCQYYALYSRTTDAGMQVTMNLCNG